MLSPLKFKISALYPYRQTFSIQLIRLTMQQHMKHKLNAHLINHNTRILFQCHTFDKRGDFDLKCPPIRHIQINYYHTIAGAVSLKYVYYN